MRGQSPILINTPEIELWPGGLLQARGGYTTTGLVALELGVPLYAADAALERAYLEGMATFQAGAGWCFVTPIDRRELKLAPNQRYLDLSGREGA